MIAGTCPNDRELKQILQETAAAAAAESLADHLEGCGRCAEAVDRLLAGDTLVEAMRAQATAGAAPASPALEALVQKLSGVYPSLAPGEGTMTSATDTFAEGAPPKAVQAETEIDPCALLGPPQGPEEIGRLGTYRVLKVLGSGGMGIVFQAEDVLLQRKVALKVMRPDAAAKPSARERFLREARAVAALEHEHVVAIHQVGEERGVPFLAMQWLKGMSLEERLGRAGPLSVPQVLRLGQQIARGLAAAHEAGLIHRDVKPANLWLEPEGGGRVKILDFGLARAAVDEARLTQAGVLLGTPAYMAPEQARGANVDQRCDLFSLGVVLYQLLTGQLPFRGDSTLVLLAAVLTEQPRPVQEVAALPPALAELVMQLLVKDPAGRPATAREVAERLRAIERQLAAPVEPSRTAVLPPLPAPPPRTPEVRGPRGRRRLLVAALVLVALAPLAYFFGGPVLRYTTNKGQLVVQVDDAAVEVVVKQNGVVVRDRTTQREFVLTAGNGEVEVYEKASGLKLATKKFTLTRGGKETVSVRLEAVKRPLPAGDAERRAAEWVLSIGGKVKIRVVQKEREVAAAKDLPADLFQVVAVDLVSNQQVTDAALEHLKPLTNLTILQLENTRVSDDGLRHLKSLTTLNGWLDLSYTQVSDAGLVHLKPLTNLRSLNLNATRVSDVGLVHLRTLTRLTSLGLWRTPIRGDGIKHIKALKDLTILDLHGSQVCDHGLKNLKPLTGLTRLNLRETQVGDDGIVHLRTLTKLTELSLAESNVSDAGLGHLGVLTSLQHLDLDATRVSDAGLVHLKGLTNLESLVLNHTQVSDVGLIHLKGLTKLKHLGLFATRVGAAGLAHLRGLPNLTELSLSGMLADRWAAEWVLSSGGKVTIDVKGERRFAIASVKDLPAVPFEVVEVLLSDTRVKDAGLGHLKGLTKLANLDLRNTRVSDAGLKHLRGLTNLLTLYLDGTQVSDAGLAHLKGSGNDHLLHLGLGGTQVSDAGLEHLKGLTSLGVLNLSGTQVGDTGLAYLKGLAKLWELALTGTRVTDAGLMHLKALTNLRILDLDVTQVSDAGLAHLAGLTNLTWLRVSGPRVSDAGLKHLKALTNLTRLDLPGTRISDAGLEQLKTLTKLTSLELGGTQVSGAGLAHLKTLTNLTGLGLGGMQVSDAGLVHLKGLINLRALSLYHTRVSDAGLVHLKGLIKLSRLMLSVTRVSDAGLGHLKGLIRLTHLDLDRTQVGDVTLKQLQNLNDLQYLDVTGTKVTKEGLAALRNALPKCQILCDPAVK